MKCINVPQKPVCKQTPDGKQVCRSRLINCANFAKLIKEDPIAVERIRLVTERGTPPFIPVDTNYPFDDYFLNLNRGFQ
jgi:hypothetical protein